MELPDGKPGVQQGGRPNDPTAEFASNPNRNVTEGDIAAFWTGQHFLVGRIAEFDLDQQSPNFGAASVGVWDNTYTVPHARVLAMRCQDLKMEGSNLIGRTFANKDELQNAFLAELTDEARDMLKDGGK